MTVRENQLMSDTEPLFSARCNKHSPVWSTLLTSAPWLTKVSAMLSSLATRAKSSAISIRSSNSSSLSGNWRTIMIRWLPLHGNDNVVISTTNKVRYPSVSLAQNRDWTRIAPLRTDGWLQQEGWPKTWGLVKQNFEGVEGRNYCDLTKFARQSLQKSSF